MTQPPWHRTKIVCTLGPATDQPEVLERLIGAGMDIARFNMSHGDHADHARRIQQVRQLARQTEQPVAVLIDLPGPKFRVGNLPDGSRELRRGAEVILATEALVPTELPVRHLELLQALRMGESVYLADGSIKLQVNATAADRVACHVLVGGTVRSGSGINVPESRLSALIPTLEDHRHLAVMTEVMKERDEVSWHELESEKVVRLLDVELRTGLAALEVKRRQAKYGPNRHRWRLRSPRGNPPGRPAGFRHRPSGAARMSLTTFCRPPVH